MEIINQSRSSATHYVLESPEHPCNPTAKGNLLNHTGQEMQGLRAMLMPPREDAPWAFQLWNPWLEIMLNEDMENQSWVEFSLL